MGDTSQILTYPLFVDYNIKKKKQRVQKQNKIIAERGLSW